MKKSITQSILSFVLALVLITGGAGTAFAAPAVREQAETEVPAEEARVRDAAEETLSADADPDGSEAAATETEAAAEPAQTGPEETEDVPETIETEPAETEDVPETIETEPAETEDVPETIETGPAEMEDVPETIETGPAETEDMPETAKTDPAEADPASDPKPAAPDETELKPGNAGMESDPAENESAGQDELFPEDLLTEETEESYTDVPDPDILLQQYLDQELFGEVLPEHEDPSGEKARSAKSADSSSYNGDKLTGADAIAYEALKAGVTEIAQGRQTSTVVSIDMTQAEYYDVDWYAEDLGLESIGTVSPSGTFTPAEGFKEAYCEAVGYHPDLVFQSVLRDCPYEMYWFGLSYSYRYYAVGYATVGGERVLRVWLPATVTFTIRASYDFAVKGSGSGIVEDLSGNTYQYESYVVDRSVVSAVNAAIANARTIAENGQYNFTDDYERLFYYFSEVRALSAYNSAAAQWYLGGYGNPWQIIWLFDNDPETTVVCEGYAKSLQLLCDMTTFTEDIVCYSVTGDFNRVNNNHMWNIVRMEDGKNYLIDVTNCSPSDPWLFLAIPSAGSAEAGYYTVDGRYTYYYDMDADFIFSMEELTLSDSPYFSVRGLAAEGDVEGITLTWETSLRADGERIYRSTNGSDYSMAVQIDGAGVTAWTDETLRYSTGYYYKACHYYIDEWGEIVEGPLGEAVYIRTRDHINHVWDEGTVTEEPTCTQPGEKLLTCIVCDAQKTDEVPALGHAPVLTGEEEATCTEPGNTAYYTCSRCTHYFSDEACEHEIDEGSWITPAKGHDPVKTEATPATCTEPGNNAYYTCSRCGLYFSDEACKKKISEGSWITPAKGHSPVETVTRATLSKDGQILTTCSVCGTELSRTAIAHPAQMLLSEMVYVTDGTQKKPSVTVKDTAGKTIRASAYTVSYAHNIRGGTGTVKVTFRSDSNYRGTMSEPFRICFTDVPLTHSYQAAVYWAADNGITTGYTDGSGRFGIGDPVTRGQFVMFLWRIAGKPEPSGTGQTFSDVPVTHSFYKAIQWAYEEKITTGYTGKRKGIFGVNDNVTRGQLIQFLWRFAHKPEPAGTSQTFTDVPVTHSYYKAIQWASENNITNGYRDGSFGVGRNCTRGQCVQFLYKFET